MAEWKLCSDKGLSALPAAISERCHRYGDGRLFSLIIGNCECVSVPAHRYSNIKDTCQRKPVLWNLMSSTTTVEMHGLMFTVHSQAPHRWESSAQLMRTSNCSWKGPEGKELWQKICLTVSAWQKKKKLTYIQWNSGELREIKKRKKRKSVILFTEGCLGPACDVITLMVSHLEEVLGDVQQGGRLGHVSLL